MRLPVLYACQMYSYFQTRNDDRLTCTFSYCPGFKTLPSEFSANSWARMIMPLGSVISGCAGPPYNALLISKGRSESRIKDQIDITKSSDLMAKRPSERGKSLSYTFNPKNCSCLIRFISVLLLIKAQVSLLSYNTLAAIDNEVQVDPELASIIDLPAAEGSC